MAYHVQVEERVESDQALSSVQQNGFGSPLNELIGAMGKVQRWTPLFRLVEDGLAEIFHADSCLVMLWNERGRVTLRAEAFGPVEDHVLQPPQLGEVGLSDAVVELGRAIEVKDVFNSPYVNSTRAFESPIQSMLGVPLQVQGRPLGVALLGYHHPQSFTREELDRAERIGEQIAGALSQSRPLKTLGNGGM